MKIIEQRIVLGRDFKIYGDFEKPLFLAKDVAEWIEYDVSSINKMLNSVDDNEKVRKIIPTPGGNQESWFLTEDGLYEVLMQSRKPIAKEFKKQVKEILKTIRKHGMYAEDEILDNPDLLIKVASKLKEEKEARILSEQKNEELQLTIESQKTKVLFADAIETSDDTISIGALAKLIQNSGSNLGRNKLFELLRKDGYLIKSGYDRNLPTQRVIKSGLMEIYESVIIKPNGDLMDTRTPVVTGKGQIYFVNRYKGYVQEAETKQVKTDKIKDLQRLVDKLTRENKKLEGKKFDGEEHLGKFIEF